MPPLSVHGFRFCEDVEGFVVTLAAPLITHLQGQLGNGVNALAQAESYPASQDAEYLNSLFFALQAEYTSHQPARKMLMHSLVGVIMVWVSRQVIQRRAASQRPQRAREYLNGYIQLVEETQRQHVNAAAGTRLAALENRFEGPTAVAYTRWRRRRPRRRRSPPSSRPRRRCRSRRRWCRGGR